MLRSGKIEAITLDVTNTLIKLRYPATSVYARKARDYGIQADERQIAAAFPEAFKSLELENPCYDNAGRGAYAWWHELVRRCLSDKASTHTQLSSLTRDLFDYYASADAWQLTHIDNAKTLRALRERGLKIAAITNFDERLHRILAELCILDFFDELILSGECGYQKPNKAIFKLALERLKISDATRVVHIGDDFHKDYVGAQAVGLNALIISEKQNENVPSEHQLRSFEEINNHF